jgi:hypothetical protein
MGARRTLIEFPKARSGAGDLWKRIALGSTVGLAVALPLSLAAITGHALTASRLMGADSLWSLAFLRDILSRGGHLADWNLAQHADFFPDKFIGAVAYLISDRPETWLFAFESLNLALYFGIAWYCFGLLARAARAKATGVLALWAALLVTAMPAFLRSWNVFPAYFQYVGGPAHHFGAYFCALLAAFFALDSFDNRAQAAGARLAAACVLMLLCGLSDKLSLALAVPGLVVAAFYAAAMRRHLSRQILLSCGAMCAAALVAYAASGWLFNGIVEISPAEPHFGIVRIEQQIRYLLLSLLMPPPSAATLSLSGVILPVRYHWTGLADLLRALDPIQTALSAAAFIFVAASALVYARQALATLRMRGRPERETLSEPHTYIVYLVASTLLLPATLMVGGVLYSQGVELYLFPAAYGVLWALAAKLCLRAAPTLTRTQLAGATIATGLLFSFLPIDRVQPPFAPAPQPPLARCLQEFGKTRALRLGLGAHWDTYPVEFATEGRIVVRAVAGIAQISHWVDSYAWYGPRMDGGLYTFIVESEEIDTDGLAREIGPPLETLACSALGPGFSTRTILVYDRLRAERLTAWIEDQYRRGEHR